MDNDKSYNFLQKKSLGNNSRANTSNRWLESGTGLGKLPPQALELEEAVLGALMIEKDALNAVIDILKSDSFYKEAHQRIYNAIITLFTNSEPIDLLTVTNQLRQLGELEIVGGAQYVTSLTTKINSAANIEYHARVVAQSAMKREMITVASKILQDAFEDTTDVFTLLDAVEQSLFKISESNIRKNYADMSTLMNEALKELERRREQKDGLTGVPSGFTQLDRLTSGWQPTELIILAARPAMGKTAFVVSSLRNAAVDFGMPVAIFSLEMSAVQLVNRMISAEAELDSEKLKKGNLAPHEWTQLHQRIDRLMRAPIFIDDTPALSILELRAKCRRLKQQHDIQMVVIDYLQLMQGDGGKGGGNREQEIASISRALKNLAKELNVPVIALSQLSRAVETRGGDKRPQLSDLRESGSIEQDADMVAFLYRPEYYGFTQDEAGNSVQGIGEVIVAKNRSGSLDTIQLRFIGKYTKFTDLDGYYSSNTPNNAALNSGAIPASFETPSPAAGGTFRSKANDLGAMNFPPPNPSEEPPF
ncbi:replicative DNA helicase [Runella slithyformis]|uniref:Replicative DNA helicase n=1 Tax=Runella slithyformis (strain ATCC 29530 / DSM 19594 / LMG 11500 / NCIMB 11436 / LSU 4) TaxID=761193 RepID=A0A7U3ZQP3_RUNSL|nr:replicative DNA helicase [Runella slithyformis]AEI51604.1 replicative DNA helicase [Runella slithyformis DSM 19594]